MKLIYKWRTYAKLDQEFHIQTGLCAAVETIVAAKDTAIKFGSGAISVFATPSMIALMEKAALSAVDLHLPKGYATVGTRIEVEHIAATPVGMKVRADAELIEINGRALTFKVRAFDENEMIGEGVHQRYIVNIERFLNKANSKFEKGQ
jgi:predicted thioesterase